MMTDKSFPWLPAGLAAMLTLGAVLSVLRLPAIPLPTGRAGRAPRFSLILPASAEEETRWREWWAVHSFAPLYQPANAGPGAVAIAQPGSMAVGREFSPKFTTPESQVGLKFAEAGHTPADAIQSLALTDPPADASLAIGRSDSTPVRLPKRIGAVEAVVAASGHVAWGKDLTAVPDALEDTNWQPFELVGTITSTGLVGGLLPKQSSGSVEVDGFFRDLLIHGEHVGERLPPGTYFFRIAP